MRKQHVVVIGGGLIGLCASHALLQKGHKVTIIERDHLGAGAATGNAGELTPQMVAPLASPNTARDVIKGSLSNSHYLSIDPLRLPQLARFGVGFLLSSRPTATHRGAAALAQFANALLPALHEFEATGIDISGGGEGFLMTSSNSEQLRSLHQSFTARAERNWGTAPSEILKGASLHEAEPSLQEEVTTGFYLPGEFSLNPRRFVASLIESIRAGGAEIYQGLTATKLGSGASVICEDQRGQTDVVSGDRVLVAAGAWTTKMLRKSGVRSAPITAGKGYSFTVPVDTMPRTVVHADDYHFVAVPMDGQLRIVGKMDFDNQPSKFDARRIQSLANAAQKVIANAKWDDRTEEWVGPRPMTTDGLPLLGPVAGRPEVLVASGHNMHGLSLGPMTAHIVADLIDGSIPSINDRPVDLVPFAVER